MSSEPAICVEQLSKLYHLYSRPVDRLKHILFGRLGKSYGHPFWALRDISFQILRGESFGVIGRNGSGKSTLLQLLAGILQPTKGHVEINGRITALLELGSGFNPEFTGRENVFLNGMILGMSRQEIGAKFDDIVNFADIGEFIEQPVKIYSSGMFVRLAFAVATGVDADVILLDEALAVGDLFFRQKCYQRLDELRRNGVSIILVSHAMNEVEQFCERALLLSEGQGLFIGSAVEAVKRYYLLQQMGSERLRQLDQQSSESKKYSELTTNTTGESFSWPNQDAFLKIDNLVQASTVMAVCTAIALCDLHGRPTSVFEQGQTAVFFFEFKIVVNIEIPIGGVEIVNDKGFIIHGKNSLLSGAEAPAYVRKDSHIRFRQELNLEVAPGEYSFNLGLTTIRGADYALRADLPHPELDARITVLTNLPNAGSFAVVHRLNGEPVQLMHYGMVNLPGQLWINIIPPQ